MKESLRTGLGRGHDSTGLDIVGCPNYGGDDRE